MKKYGEIIKFIIICLLILLSSVIIIASFTGCSTVFIKEPVRMENESYPSYMARYNNYLSAKSKMLIPNDKWSDMATKIYMYEYCNDPENLWKDDKPQNCYDKLD